ncbi:helix-turn-helix domain-containing protein [Paracoccus aestuariivivens]|uniref:Helix-turn-helix domain-containing protein n=2 Tax=Paracoccus aestuariivivens TaxID=1820333 RepID=A0A6L6JF34_9RHOB|nr:helix-turn-helix domain-containing protein [Paracoccus aestuariivivens]
MSSEEQSIGDMLRDWRQRRRCSQLALALEAEISQRHLSFLETGRALPSREMLMRLADSLDMPPRARNAMLLAAGFAPVHVERSLSSPELTAAREAIDRILQGHEPYPALAVDRIWTLLSANKAVGLLTQGVSPSLLAGEVNVLRLSLHPEGLAPRIVNYREWRAHILLRLGHDIGRSADPKLIALSDELKSYPVPPQAMAQRHKMVQPSIAIPLILASDHGALEFISTTTVFGTAIDITLAEIVIESFFPANAATAVAMQKLS